MADKRSDEIQALAAELVRLVREGREAEIAPHLSEIRTRWGEQALHDRDLAEEVESSYYYYSRCLKLAEGRMDERTDEEIQDLVRAAKDRGLAFEAACDSVIARFFDSLDDNDEPVGIAPDHWRAYRVRQLAMEIYQPPESHRSANNG